MNCSQENVCQAEMCIRDRGICLREHLRKVQPVLSAIEGQGGTEKRGGEKVRSLIKRPGEGWTVTEIQNELEPLQKAVGGHLEAVTLWADACVLCNEEGRIKGMPYNTTICGVSFVGPILIVGTAGEDFSDLTEQQEAALRAMGAVR